MNKKIFEKILREFIQEPHIISFSEPDEGVANDVYRIETEDKNMYIKFYDPLFESWKPRKEAAVISLLNEKTDLPVPKLLFFSENKKFIDRTYIIMEELKGKSYSEIRENLTEKERISILEKSAVCLAKMHSIEFDSFGDFYLEDNKIKVSEFHLLKSGPFDQWKDAFLKMLYLKLNVLNSKGVFSKYVPDMLNFIEQRKNLLDGYFKPVFNHIDFNPTNVLINNNEIGGLIDFEWSQVGHNKMELTTVDNNGWFTSDREREAFRKTYFSIIPYVEENKERIKLYRLNQLIEDLFSFDELPKTEKANAKFKKQLLRIEDLLYA